MKILGSIINCNTILFVGIIAIIIGCSPMSETEHDSNAGINGSFEVVANGLPVNWQFYTPKTVPDTEFSIIIDSTNYKDGKRSLKFDVLSISNDRNSRYPGLTSEFIEAGKFSERGKYKVGMWIMNKGSQFEIIAGGVAAKTGNMNTLISSNEEILLWKYLEYNIDISNDNWLRLELRITAPGTFWIDGITVERIS